MHSRGNLPAGFLPISLTTRRLLPSAVVLIVGTLFSLWAFDTLWEEETKNRQIIFERIAEARFAAIEKSVTSTLEGLHALAGLFAASQEVSRVEFGKFTTYLSLSSSGVQAFEWIPRVARGQRAALERAAHEEGYPDFQFTERNQQGKMARAGERDEYYPVYFVEPLGGNEAAFGFDLGSEATRLAALAKARDTGEMVASARITLVQEQETQFGFLVFLAVYDGGGIPDGPAERSEKLMGFVLGVFRVGGIVHQSEPDLADDGQEPRLYLFDVSAPSGKQLLFPRDATAGNKDDLNFALSFNKKLIVGDRSWEVVIAPGPNSLKPIWEPWAVLGGGLLFTILISAYLLFNLFQRLRLVESEQRFQDFAESSADWLWEMDENLRFIFMSPNVERILGVEPEWYYGKTRQELLSPDYDKGTWNPHLKLLREHKPFRDFIYLRVGGGIEPKWISTSGSPFFDVQGTFKGYRGVASDASFRLEAENELTRVNADMARLIDTANAPIFGVDGEGNVNEWNHKVAEITGYSKEEVFGRSLVELLIPAQNRKSVLEVIANGMAGEERSNYESPILTKAGRTVDILLNLTTRRDAEGNIVGVIGVGQDITERKQAEIKLERLAALVENSSDFFGMCNPDGRVFYVNKAGRRLLGLAAGPRAELHRMNEYLPDNDSTEFFESIFPSVRTGGEWQGNIALRNFATGETIPVEMTVFGIIDSKSNELTACATVCRDIRERLRAEKEQTDLRQAIELSDKMASLGQLAAGVAHEINNPIGFINSNLKTAREYVDDIHKLLLLQGELEAQLEGDGKGTASLLKRIRTLKKEMDYDFIVGDHPKLLADSIEGAGRVIDIIHNMRSFAHMDSGPMEEADINQGIESTLKLVLNEFKYKAVIKKQFGRISKIECHAQQLNQVFLNILVNAAQAIEDHGEVIISTEMENGEVIIRFKDNGKGISPENLAHIFEPFFTTKEIGEGTGLGLSVSYNIIQQHNGAMEVQSKVGEGTEFIIRLPVKFQKAKVQD